MKYLGCADLMQYFVKSYTMLEENYVPEHGSRGVQVDFVFGRRLLNHALTEFIPPIFICIVSFCTSFFKVKMSTGQKGAALVVPNFSFSPQILRPL